MINQNMGFYGQIIDSQCQIHNMNTLTGALVADLLISRVNLHIFLKIRLAYSHDIYIEIGVFIVRQSILNVKFTI